MMGEHISNLETKMEVCINWFAGRDPGDGSRGVLRCL